MQISAENSALPTIVSDPTTGEVDVNDIVCSACDVKEDVEGNDVLLCDYKVPSGGARDGYTPAPTTFLLSVPNPLFFDHHSQSRPARSPQ